MKNNVVFYYFKRDDGTYNVVIVYDNQDIESLCGIGQNSFDSILEDYSNARVVDVTNYFIK